MLPFHRLSAYPVLHELYGRLVAQCRVQPFPIVKHLDVFKRHRLHLIVCTKAFVIIRSFLKLPNQLSIGGLSQLRKGATRL